MNPEAGKTHYRIPTSNMKRHYDCASQQDWEEFLRHVGYEATAQEKEADGKLRYSIIESLVVSGKVRIVDDDVLLLPEETGLICTDFIKEGTWAEDLCCLECHKDSATPIFEYPDRWRQAFVCCHFSFLRDKWLAGQEISQETLQTLHDDGCLSIGVSDYEYPGIDVIKQLLSGC